MYTVLFSGKCNGTIEVPTFLCIHSLVHYHDHDVTKSSIFSINPALFIIFLTWWSLLCLNPSHVSSSHLVILLNTPWCFHSEQFWKLFVEFKCMKRKLKSKWIKVTWVYFSFLISFSIMISILNPPPVFFVKNGPKTIKYNMWLVFQKIFLF